MRTRFSNPAPYPALGGFQDGYAPLARRFAAHLDEGEEIGASLAVYVKGECVAHLWGGHADLATQTRWAPDSRIVVFSATKGLAAMALHLLAARGKLEWDAPVTSVWPAFGARGKERMTLRELFNHRGGLSGIDRPLTLAECVDPASRGKVSEALEQQRPAWAPGEDQGYHAITFGLYAREVFERVAGEPMGPFLRRELFDPLESDARMGAEPELDASVATLYPPTVAARLTGFLGAIARGSSAESLLMKDIVSRDSLTRRAFVNPRSGPRGVLAYNDVPVRRADLPWASATSSADGLARAYLPFANGGEHGGRRYFDASTLAPIFERQSWSERDRVLHKPCGWSQGFLKEEEDVFAPRPESFGHPGMGGSLGWCDPVGGVTVGYVMNKMDWRVRSPRSKALLRALYACEPLLP